MSNPDPSAVQWRKSTHSSGQGGQCVEVAALPSGIALRDSKDPDGPRLLLSGAEWQAFMRRAKAGRTT